MWWVKLLEVLRLYWRLHVLTGLSQAQPEVGANPVQVEIGDFDEAIDVVEEEEDIAESE